MDLLPYTTQLDDGKPRLLLQTADIRLQRTGFADAVAEDISAGLLRLRRQRAPVLLPQKQRGVQHHGRLSPADLPDNGLSSGLPGGEVGKVCQVLIQFILHSVRNAGNAKRGGVGNFPARRELAEKHRVKVTVGENLRIPDLVAAGEIDVARRRASQFLQASIPVLRDMQMADGEVLKPVVPFLHGVVVERRVSVRRSGAKAGGAAEQVVVLIHIVVENFTLASQLLHSPLGGAGL
ncbi:hypothetical protein SDC9_90611 [bioreactor metagenome]|uniref:Uncharacterized protein n=1 Tax=bioreactor metagenome TaxID=1076179 RepID=A0A644ZZ91_9ZZZZ